jgi:hypothetical protein
MPQGPNRYARQRSKVVPPHVTVGDLRVALGMTIDEVISRIEKETGRTVTRGAISAVENGHRGASDELLRSLEIAYGLHDGAITTTYRPRAGRNAA